MENIYIPILILFLGGCKKISSDKGVINYMPHSNDTIECNDSIIKQKDNRVSFNYPVDALSPSDLIMPTKDLIPDKSHALRFVKIILKEMYQNTALNSLSTNYSIFLVKNKIWYVRIVLRNMKQESILLDKHTGAILRCSIKKQPFVQKEQTAVNIAKFIWKQFYRNDNYDSSQNIYEIKKANDSLWFIKNINDKWMKGGESYILIKKKNAQIIGILHSK